MMHFKRAFVLLALAVIVAQAKPSFPYGFQPVPDHIDLAPPVLPPPAHFHDPTHIHNPFELAAAWPAPGHLLHAPGHLLPAPEQLLPPPLPAPVFQAPAPVLPASFFHAPTPVLPAAPLLPPPTQVIHTQLLPAPAPLLPAPLPVADVHPPLFEAIPFATPIPSYRAIPGPKTTTHHVSIGYAYPQTHFGLHGHHLHAAPHAHIRTAPLALGHHHHHSLF